MQKEIVYVLGTLLAWVGWAGALYAIWKIARRVADRSSLVSAPILIGAVCSGMSLVLSHFVLLSFPNERVGTVRFPLAWVQMPFPVWLIVIAIIYLAINAYRFGFAVNDTEKKSVVNRLIGWLAVLAVGAYFISVDPQKEFIVLTGGVRVSPALACGLILLAIAAVIGMALASRTRTAQKYATAFTTQLALLIGSFIFGIPFAFALITSFKEDRDMANPDGGIIWVPRVQETVPFLDPRNPLFEADLNGRRVQATKIGENRDGTALLDVYKPLSIRGTTFSAHPSTLKQIPRDAPIVVAQHNGESIRGFVSEELENGERRVRVLEPDKWKDREILFEPAQVEPVRKVGLRWQNYEDTFSYLPPETNNGLTYLRNTLVIVILSVIGTILSSAIVAYAFSRMSFPARDALFNLLLSTMMLPAAVTLLPQFLIFRTLGWIDTLFPLWVPAFFGSAFNIFLLRQFFKGIPMELEDASKIDGCSYLRTFWSIMVPQIKPALAVIAIWTFMGAWNNFMGPLIYINSPENMPLSYALQLFQGERSLEPGLLMAFSVMTMMPVLLLFFFAQRYFIEGVTLSGLGGR
jgi:multiple sugar transport system permease protein